MSYLKFGMAIFLSFMVATTAGQLFGQQSNSVAIFAPMFAPDFEDALIESPPDNLVIDVANVKPDGASLADPALALPVQPGASSTAIEVVNRDTACNGCSKEVGACCPGCPSCDTQPAANMKGHCQLMAKLLSIAIQDGEQTQDAQRKVIEAALMMIAETSEAKAQAKIARLEASHLKQLTSLKRQLEKSTPASSSFSQIREWLGPIYTNQNRNFHQLQTITANSKSLNRAVGLLGKKIDAKRERVPPQKIQNRLYGDSAAAEFNSNHHAGDRRLLPQHDQSNSERSYRINPTEHAIQLRREIQALQDLLNELQQEAVRPANHLEPVFTPDQPLKPLYQR